VLEADTSPAGRAERCPGCGTERAGNDQYCERCGHDFLSEQSPDAGRWEAIVRADAHQFARFASAGISFPSDYGERRFELDQPKLRIGRSRAGAGDAPEIDLAGTVEDPCISRKHAVLERQTDGSYAVRDLQSTNGTTINDDPQPVDSDQGVVLADGDLIRIGAWTTLTIQAR
jgi:FHA domain